MNNEIAIHGENNTVITIQRPPSNDRAFRLLLVLLGAMASLIGSLL